MSEKNEEDFVPIDFSRYIVDVGANDDTIIFQLDFGYSPAEQLDAFAPSLRALELPRGKALNNVTLNFT